MILAPPHRYRIVAALDASEYAEIVLEHALDQAARHDAPDLHFLRVVGPHHSIDEAKARLARLVVEGVQTFRRDRQDWRTRLHVRIGKPDEEIANLAAEIQADLLVVGRFGRHRGHYVNDLLANAGCPTLVVGLTEHVVDSHPQCPTCVAVREATDGEKWFCAEHTGSGEIRLTALLPSSTTAIPGGPLW